MTVVLTIPDQKYIGEHSKQIMAKMKEYRDFTGKCWPPFNYNRGYASAEEWHKALLEKVESLQRIYDQMQHEGCEK